MTRRPPPQDAHLEDAAHEPARHQGPAPFSVRRALLVSGGARLVVLPVTGISTLVIARLTTDAVGVDQFGAVMLIATLGQLLVFADLGAGAAVATASTRMHADADETERFRGTLLTALRTVICAAVVLGLVAVGVAIWGDWAALLGIEDASRGSAVSADVAVVVALLAFGTSLPFALGEPVLRGSGRLHRAVLLMGLSTPTALLLTVILRAVDAPALAYALALPLGGLLGSMLCAAGAWSAVRESLRELSRQLLRPRRFPGAAIAATAVPMFIVMVGLPVALQSDRIIISHQVGSLGLSDYSYAVQLYTPLWSVVSVAALALWPAFAGQDGQQGALRRDWLRCVALLGAAGTAFAVAFLVLAGPVIGWTSGGTSTPGLSLLLGFAALLIAQALHVGSGILLITPAQLRLQAVCVVALLATNLPLSWVLAPTMGAAGPVWASTITVVACQLVPGAVAAYRATSPESAVDGCVQSAAEDPT